MNTQNGIGEGSGAMPCSTLRQFVGTIRDGAVVYQDFAFFSFYEHYSRKHLLTKFIFQQVSEDHFRGTADGFGSFVPGEEYGNGSVTVCRNDIIGVPFVEMAAGI